MSEAIARPDELCSCPHCGKCLLTEEETEDWDDAVYEDGKDKTRIMECSFCGGETQVTLITETEYKGKIVVSI